MEACISYITRSAALNIEPGSGISKATCLALAKEGARGIMIADINLTTAMQTADECLTVGTHLELEAEGVELDVSVETSVSQVVGYMVKRFGRIDCCVNGAGVRCSLLLSRLR